MQPLVFFSSSTKATEHAEKWQSVMNKTMSFREDVGTPHAVSMESHKDMSDVTLAAAEELLEQSIDVGVLIRCALFPSMNTHRLTLLWYI